MPRRRALAALLVLLLIALVAAVATWSATSTESPDETRVRRPVSSRSSASRVRSGEDVSEPRPSDESKAAPASGSVRTKDPDWYDDLQKLLDQTGTPQDDAARNAILAAAGRNRLPGGDLHEVLRRATEDLARARNDEERRRAQRVVDWVLAEVRRPYHEDRAKFAAVYRLVRFGDGALDAPGNSLVRMFRFADAAKRIEELRPELQTWCYDALAIRAADAFRRDASNWAWFRKTCEARRWDVPPDPAWEVAATRLPSELGRTFVLPHLADLGPQGVLLFARILADAGEPEVAAECLPKVPPESAKEQYWNWVAARVAEIEPEIAALTELKRVAGFRVPVAAGGTPNLAAWFAKHCQSGVAHAIGTDGVIELGAWDDEMTKSFLESGLAWAPEEWEVERRRLAAAESAERDGIRGFVVRSPQWEVFSDVSAEFSAQATLVLESAFLQAQAGLGLGVWTDPPIGARIFRRRQDYQAITNDRSGGHWVPKLNSVLTFLDDPTHTDFDDFRYPTLVHEATHAAVAHYAGSTPSWMQEGLASLVARWNPTWSHAKNDAVTAGFVSRAKTLEASRDAGLLPSLDELMRLTDKWDADAFGSVTMARYAAAESLFVHLYTDAEHWKTAAAWIDAVRRRRDPSAIPVGDARQALASEWKDFVEWSCSRLAGER